MTSAGASPQAMRAVAIAIAALASAGPRLTERKLERAIQEAQRSPAIADRIERLSRLFLGTPYGQFPLGEGSGVEPQPRWRADMLDCQTYVETVLAMANARSLAEAKALLDDIRYGSMPISFATRNHFAEAQWLPANEAKGYLQEETTQLDPQSPSATLVLHRERWSAVKGLERLATANIPEGEFSIRYLPLDDARKLAAQFAPGSVLLIVRAADPERVVRVSHMALVVKTPQGLAVRHASFGREREVIEEGVEAFLDRQRTYRNWPVLGVALALPLDARARAAHLRQREAAASLPGPEASAQPQPNWSFGGPLPGATAFDESLVKKLSAKWAARNLAYKPRTRHLRPDGSPKYTNRLFLESSPYLLQHAHNPTNWYPWGNEAFETAKKLGRPVLLSVGYSTCHWCHVMEEESFEDEEIARTLNESYVAIKVDREERPDVDAIYMTAVQLLTGSGGWPMTVWLTPDRKPFYGGTYFPARDGDRGARVGFLTLLGKLREAYDQQPDRVSKASGEIVQAVRDGLSAGPAGDKLPDATVLKEAFRHYRDSFDWANGGLGGAPKFPSSLPVRFLLRYHRRTGDAQALQMATLTLEKMAAGGMYDHVGGGFHRYSTDARWLVPHFEKMLYDNALLAFDYLEAYQATGRKDFAGVAREILRYVERDMTSPEGAFYSATDADSLTPSGRREEGYFFTWTSQEIEAALGKERARAVEAFYAVTAAGNFEGRNILHAARPLAEIAQELNEPPEKLHKQVEEARQALYTARALRPPPLRDEKILAAWNGLMISAYARAALVLGDASYADRAASAAEFVLGKMLKNGRLRRSYKDGQARNEAVLEDYAFLAAGLIDLFEATDEPRWLKDAIALDAVLESHYEDKNGGFFLTPDDHETLLARQKPSYDGAEPSGNSVQALNLLRLHELTTEDRYRRRAERALRAFKDRLARAPASLSELLLAVDFQLDVPKEIVIVTPRSRAVAEPLLAELRATFLPNRVLSVVTEGRDLAAQAKVVPLVEGKVVRKGQATAYVCEKQVCELPTTDPRVFAGQIRKVQPLGKAAEAKQPGR